MGKSLISHKLIYSAFYSNDYSLKAAIRSHISNALKLQKPLIFFIYNPEPCLWGRSLIGEAPSLVPACRAVARVKGGRLAPV